MATLAIYNPSGCFGELTPGNVGEVLVQGFSGAGWAGASGIAIADIGNFFTTDNIESALQEIGERFSCDGIRDCVGDGLSIDSGLIYEPPNIVFAADNLPNANDPLSPTTRIVVGYDGLNQHGSIATLAQVATALGVIGGGGGGGVSSDPGNYLTDGSDGKAYISAATIFSPTSQAVGTNSGLTAVASPALSLYLNVNNLITYGSPLSGGMTIPIDTGSGTYKATISALASAIGGGGGGAPVSIPWSIVGGALQLLSSAPVAVTDNIFHTGKVIVGASTIQSTGADIEIRGHASLTGSGHVFSGLQAAAIGLQNSVANHSLAIGYLNSIVNFYNLVVGDKNSTATSNSFISGSSNSIANAQYSSIAGGHNNKVLLGNDSFIGGGQGNIVNASAAGFIGGGNGHLVQGINAGVVTGTNNKVHQVASLIGAGNANTILGTNAFIGAGDSNKITSPGTNAMIAAGNLNQVGHRNSVIGGGHDNYIDVTSTGQNPVGKSADNAFIGAGFNNYVLANNGFIGAGNDGFIGFDAPDSFIGAGYNASITNSPRSAIVAGWNNAISSAGANNFIANGELNQIFAGFNNALFGTQCQTFKSGVFMFQSYVGATAFSAAADGEFAAVAHGGFRLRSNAARTTGVDLPAGGNSWISVSAAALKGQFTDVDPRSILGRLLKVPMRTYRFKKHEYDAESAKIVEAGYHDQINLGPTAEDWNESFSDLLGEKNVVEADGEEIRNIPAISDGDKMGVALASIQGLAMMVEELRQELAEVKQQLAQALSTKKARPSTA